MLTSKIKVRGFTRMGTFGKLFPEPDLEAELGITPESAAAAA